MGALPTSEDYERRYRLIDGIAALGDANALAVIAHFLESLPATAQRAAFEQTAARAIAVNPRPEAIDLLMTFARDADPGVRLAALDALAGVEAAAPPIDTLVETALATDHWPEVRRRAAQVLGGRCTQAGPARALGDAVAKDSDVGVRGDALAALVECHAPGTAELLARLWDDGKAPIDLRQRAVDLSVELGDGALAIKLIAKLASWRGAALESKEALALAQNAAYAVGRLAPPGAAAALIAGLDDAGFPEIVAASATGLGMMGRACPVDAREKLLQLARSDDQQVATAAARAFAICGK
jgi:HEAT repeat protein